MFTETNQNSITFFYNLLHEVHFAENQNQFMAFFPLSVLLILFFCNGSMNQEIDGKSVQTEI